MTYRRATKEETKAWLGMGIVLPGHSRTRSSAEQTSAPQHSDKTPEGHSQKTGV